LVEDLIFGGNLGGKMRKGGKVGRRRGTAQQMDLSEKEKGNGK